MKHSGLLMFLTTKRVALCISITLLIFLFWLTNENSRTATHITAHTETNTQTSTKAKTETHTKLIQHAASPGLSNTANTSANPICFAQPLDYWLNAALRIASQEKSANTDALPCIRAHLWLLAGKSRQSERLPKPSKLLLQKLSEYQLSRLIVIIAIQPEEFAEHWHSPAVLVYSPMALLEPVFELLHTGQAPPHAAHIKKTLLNELVQHAIRYFPDSAVSILLGNRYEALNLRVVHALLKLDTSAGNRVTLPQLSQLWPAMEHALLGKYHTFLQEYVIELYLAANRFDTLRYLADYFQVVENTENLEFPRRFNFPKAINTLLAWELNQLHYLDAEHYDADSELVTRGVSKMLADNPKRVFSHLTQISSAPLRDKVMASIVQSKGFFNLEQAEFVALLREQPAELATQLANAYVLQFAHLPRSDYQQTIVQMADFITLQEAL